MMNEIRITNKQKGPRRYSEQRILTWRIVVFHYRASMDKLKGMLWQLGIVCNLLPNDGKLCVGSREGKV